MLLWDIFLVLCQSIIQVILSVIMWTLKGIIMSKQREYREGNNIPCWRREQDHQFHVHELLKVYSEDSLTNPRSLYPYSVCCWHSTHWKAKMEDCPCPNHWSRTNWRSASPLWKSHEPHHPPQKLLSSPTLCFSKQKHIACDRYCCWNFLPVKVYERQHWRWKERRGT